ncbi:MAG: cohesin domain-containing protein [Anaerolineae bacterium]
MVMQKSLVSGRTLSVVLILSLAFIGLSLMPAEAQPVEVSIPDIQQTNSPTGDSPLVGKVVTVDGIVTALDPQDGGLDGYFIQEPEDGPWSGVYVADASGNRPAVGDLIHITGQVEEIQGLTVVTNLQEFTVVSNDNPLPAARGVTARMLHENGEPWESVWAAVHAVTVASRNPDAPDDVGEWLVSDATDASIRVGHLLGDYDYAPVEGDELVMVRGVVYFSSDAFKIEPAGSADILEQADYTTIYAIQTVPDQAEDDASPLDGERVKTAGVVTGVFFPADGGVRYVVEDARGGPWSGVWVLAETEEDVPARGAHVELTGTVREFFGRTELFAVDAGSIVVHSVDNVLPAAAEIRTIDVATGRPAAESYEGVLIRTGQVTVTNANPDFPDDFGEWLIADAASGASVRVDDLGDYTYTPVEADELAYVQGSVDFTFNQFKIQPRDDNDIGTEAVTIGQARARPLGEQVSLQGVVTVPSGLLDAGFAMQDGTGGIYVFHQDGFTDGVSLGDVAEATGILAEANGRLQVVPADPGADVQVVGMAPLPPPLQWPTGQIGEASEGWLVRLEGTVVEKRSDRLVVDDGTGPVDVVIGAATGIDLSSVAVDQGVTIVGLSSQFDEEAPFDSGYQVLPRFQTDVNPTGPALLTPTPSATPSVPATAVVISPASSTVSLGGVVTSAVEVVNVAGLYATEVHVRFDPAIVQVVDADAERPGVQVAPGSLFVSRNHFLAVNRVNNDAGTVDFAVSLLNPEQPIDGSGDVAAITWRAVSPGTTSVELTDVVLADQAGQPLSATLQDGGITVLPATATPTPTMTPTATSTATPTPTSTPTPEGVATPTCDGGLCGGSLVVRAFYDFRCDGGFNAGVDRGIAGARVTLQYDNGAQVVKETTDYNSGYAHFNGVNLPDGATATLSIEWPARADSTLIACPNSRDTVTLTAQDFGFGANAVNFRASKTRE